MTTPTPQPAQETSHKKRFIYAGALLILLLLVGGAFVYKQMSRYVGTNDAQIDGYKVDLSSDLLLRIIKLYVDEGDFVEEGQIVCKLDDSILLSQKAEAIANISAMQSMLALREYELAKIKKDYERARQGQRDQIISPQDYDHAHRDFQIAQSAVDVAKADIEESVRQLGVIEATLAHTNILATHRGSIVKRWVQAGDVVQPGQAIFSLADLHDIWVVANLQETDIQRVRLGDTVKIEVDAYPGVTFQGKVYVIRGSAAGQFSLIPPDNATGNYTKVAQRVPLKITIAPPKNFPSAEPLYLFPGLSVEVKIYVE